MQAFSLFSEPVNGRSGTRAFTLYQLNSMVRNTLEENLCGPFWLEAEISEAREVRGHCYFELIQKEI